ncbi:MAG: glycosyltransferase [Acidimicrobiia bacterium]|nr:glycosyltransferase [Acidimicrobiia bacterium]
MPTQRPDVTVVVPMRNNAATIGEQLEALSSQQYEGFWEVVVVDNGSTDGSLETAARYASRFQDFRVVDASEIRGVSHARNAGAAAGRGEVILFTDADDVVGEGWIAALVAGLERADLAGGPLDESSLNPEYAREWGDPPIPTDRFNVVAGYLPNARGNNVGIRRSVFDAIGGWNEEYRFAEDVELCWRAANAGYRLVFVPEAVVLYRRRHTVLGLARQQFVRGRQTHRIQLAQAFGHLGFRPASDTSQRRQSLGWIIRNAPAAVFDRSKRGSVIAKLSYGLGWAVGAPRRREVRRKLHRGDEG